MKKLIQIIGVALLSASAQASSLTLIAHGVDEDASGWENAMADAMVYNQARHGYACEMFTVKLLPQDLLAFPVAVKVTHNNWYIGPPLPEDDRNIIVALDWSEFSSSRAVYSTPQLIFLMMNFLMEPNQLPGFTKPLIEECWPNNPCPDGKRTLHLIGRGRGAALLYEVAYFLQGRRTIAQFTTIDPGVQPRTTDTIGIPSNVMFADNYYQTNGTIRGAQIAGAYNHQIITAPANAAGNLLDWYKETITAGSLKGYYFADCPHGVRPQSGFLTRRVGQPDLRFQYDAKRKTFSWEFGGAATGQYFLEQSADLKTWISASPDVLTFDGRSFQTPQIVIDLSVFPHWFYRLRSGAASF